MFMVALLAVSTAAHVPTGACPRQAEPTALTSAAFAVPSRGETLLFSAAPSFQSVRYALRVFRSNKKKGSSAVLIRLKRRWECNVHDRMGEWTLQLSPEETTALFDAAVALRDNRKIDDEWVVLDGNRVEVRHYNDGKLTSSYDSNGFAKEYLSKTVLGVLRKHVPPTELPVANDWRYKLPGTVI